ncbi:MAG: MraY family glycosyltransferase [Candidatus Babeliales bacterium]|jgi:UDP-GlcNAc:undecaprenyl-phosphate GlcNAc-1-phosphate transferase
MYAVEIRHIFALFFSFLLGLYIVPIVIKAAKKIGFVDRPDGRLKRHKEPTPYLGGLAIFIAFITTLGLCYPFENQMLWFLFGTTLLLFVGLIDDLKVLRPAQKFFGQFIAVLCFLKGEFSLKNAFFSSPVNIFWSSFWMLSVINAFNLVDVMDGLCGTLGLISSITLCGIAYAMGKYTTSLLLAAFIGAVGAFLVYNKPPAKIYLGDAGSLFVGGCLAAMPLLFDWDKTLFIWKFNGFLNVIYLYIKPLLEMFFVPCLILWVPLVEGLGLFIIRTRLKMPFYYGSPHHFSIYLRKKGWSCANVLVFAAAVSTLMSALATLFLYRLITLTWLMIWSILVVIGWVIMIFGFTKNKGNTSTKL